MTTYMHCRPCFGTNITICVTSFPVGRSNYVPASYHHHDQTPSATLTTPRRRRRLEDPITMYASNYYATLPGPIPQGSQPTPASSHAQPPRPPPSLPSSHQIYRQSDRNGAYCDLYNLLEFPSPATTSVTKQGKRHHSNEFNSHRAHRRINSTERKRRYPPTSSCKDKKCSDDKVPSSDPYNCSSGKSKKMNEIYQQRSSNKGFFRRVVRNYFCMPSALANQGYSS